MRRLLYRSGSGHSLIRARMGEWPSTLSSQGGFFMKSLKILSTYTHTFSVSARIFLFILLALAGNLLRPAPGAASQAADPAAIQRPVLKWQRGGCHSTWCESAYYASPVVADLDKDGKPEVLTAAYTIFILDGASGGLERRVDPPGERVLASIVLADLDRDGDREFITGHEGGYLHLFTETGDLIWSRQPTPGHDLRSILVADLERDGDLEIVAASKRDWEQWWVYEHDGRLRAGQWPQHGDDTDTNGRASGCHNQNIAAGDLDGDGRAEIIAPNDTHWIAMFNDDGSQVRTHPIFGAYPDGSRKFWSSVGVHADQAADLRGWTECGFDHRANFQFAAPLIVDLNRDGHLEAVVVGNVYNCAIDSYPGLYQMPFIFNGDRTRWSAGGFDWTEIPVPDGEAAPLSEDYKVIQLNKPNPVTVDLDGDDNLEIIYPSYDGRMHVYRLDKTVHGNWPYSVYRPQEGVIRFASEPAVADLDGNGSPEVIFTSWTQRGSGKTGKLHLLDALGRPLHELDLPLELGEDGWNGAMAAPTLANIDADPDLEAVILTANGGVVTYDLPGTSGANILWGTGRGSYLRNGPLPQPFKGDIKIFLPMNRK
jgi:hypothetical protein